MSNFRSDLKNTSFVKSPANAVVDLYEQYVHDMADVLDKHKSDKDKSDYYSKLISDNSQDPRKLWHVLRKTLSRVSEVTLPPYKSDKALADQFAPFFHNKIKTIRDTSIPSGTEKEVHPSLDPQQNHQKLAYEILPVGSMAYISHQIV